MSNNRFLQPKKSNRFEILQDDNNDGKNNPSLKNLDERKKNSKYEPSKNLFQKQPFKQDEINKNNYEDRGINRNRNRDRDRDRDINRNNYVENEQLTNRFKTSEEQTKQINLDLNDTEIFPELIHKENDSINNDKNNNKNNDDKNNVYPIKFKDILDDVTKRDDIQKNVQISPGWLQMTLVDRKIVTKHGQPTLYMENLEKQKELENDIDYIMYNIVETLKINYEEHEKKYDSINGEGAYNEKFRLSPVYGSDYDTESESENSNSNNDDNIDEYYDDNDEYSYNE